MSRKVSDDEPEPDFAAPLILNEIGIEFEEPDANRLDGIIEKFSTVFPRTEVLSGLARLMLPEVRTEDDPNVALVTWLGYEEVLFRRLERRNVATRLEEGFLDQNGTTNVDGFVRFLLSVQIRRKSRMGQHLEHHLEAFFRAYKIVYARGAVTENNQRPDNFVSQQGSLLGGT